MDMPAGTVEGLLFLVIFGLIMGLLVLLLAVIGFFCFFPQKQFLFFCKLFGYKSINGVFLGVEQVKNNFGLLCPLFVVGYEENGVKQIVKLQKIGCLNGFFGDVKNIQMNSPVPLVVNKKTNVIYSGLITEIYRWVSIVDGAILLLISGYLSLFAIVPLLTGGLFLVVGV